MNLTVCKFGGSSLANAAQIRKVIRIIKRDPKRRFIVVSAPGKAKPSDRKITDLLLLCHALHEQNLSISDAFGAIESTYRTIVADLRIAFDIDTPLEHIRTALTVGASVDFVASRGEWLLAQIMARALLYDFVDAAGTIFFDHEGRYDEASTLHALTEMRDAHTHAVIPGFYGTVPNGDIKTFSRGGSDITGAIVAHGINADLYENWTDVPGLSMADPRIIPNAHALRVLSYNELAELADGGAQVLHQGTIFPARDAGITINVRDTNHPDDPGTLIVADASTAERPYRITGIASKHFTVITVGKRGINPEVGFLWTILGILKDYNVSVQHFPGGNNSISLAIEHERLPHDTCTKIVSAIKRECAPDFVLVNTDTGILTVVGQNMINRPGIAATLFTALGHAGINVRLMSQGSSELTIVIGVASHETERAIHAIYNAFITI